MLAYKEKEKDKPIKVTTNTKRRTKEQIKNRILGSLMIILGFISMLIPAENGECDGTAFVFLLIIGTAAVFSK